MFSKVQNLPPLKMYHPRPKPPSPGPNIYVSGDESYFSVRMLSPSGNKNALIFNFEGVFW